MNYSTLFAHGVKKAFRSRKSAQYWRHQLCEKRSVLTTKAFRSRKSAQYWRHQLCEKRSVLTTSVVQKALSIDDIKAVSIDDISCAQYWRNQLRSVLTTSVVRQVSSGTASSIKNMDPCTFMWEAPSKWTAHLNELVVRSPWGCFDGLSPQNKAPSPPKWQYETLSIRWVFVKFWNVKPHCLNRKPPYTA